MTPRSVLGATLRDRGRGLVGWVAGIGTLTAFVLVVYETLWQSDAVQNLIRRFPPPMQAMLGINPELLLSGAGYIQTQLYMFVAPVVVLIYAIGFGATATTREEDRRTVDLLLSLPLRRERVIAEKFLALTLLLSAIVTTVALTLAVGNVVTGAALPLHGIVAANSGLLLIGLLHGTLAMAVGAGTGSRAAAAATAGTLAVGSFVLQGLLQQGMTLRPLVAYLPFDWYLREMPVLEGFNIGQLWLALATLAFLAAAMLAFRRRDLSTAAPLFGGDRPRAKDGRAIEPRSGHLLGGIYGKSLWLRRRAIVGWIIGLCGIAWLTMAFWPIIEESAPGFEALVTMVPQEIFAAFGMSDPKELFTAAGFLSARLYATIGVLMMLAFAIGMGAASVAGEERRGTMELQLSTPLSRRRIVLGAFAAMVTFIALLAASLFAVMLAGNAVYDLELVVESIASATVGLALTGVFFGALALAIGAATGNAALARGVPAALAVAGFIVNGLGAAVASLAPLRYLSPMYWYLGNSPALLRGFTPGVLVLPAAGLLLIGVAMLGFERRDVKR